MIYRFFGANSEIGGVAILDSLGQKVNLSPEAALDAMKGGCVILPEAEYAALGITVEEEKKFRYVGSRGQAPAEFKAKIAKGLARYRQTLDEDQMGISPEVVERFAVKPAEPPAAPAAPAAPVKEVK